jgi:hypothetical protein
MVCVGLRRVTLGSVTKVWNMLSGLIHAATIFNMSALNFLFPYFIDLSAAASKLSVILVAYCTNVVEAS